MSKQKIIVINTGHAADFGYKEFTNQADLNGWLKEVVETIDLSKDIKVFVGEERCLEIKEGRASYSFNLSMAGCGCGKAQMPKNLIENGGDYEPRN